MPMNVYYDKKRYYTSRDKCNKWKRPEGTVSNRESGKGKGKKEKGTDTIQYKDPWPRQLQQA